MKELFLGLGLVLVLGVTGFAYRAIIERPQASLPMVCTQEAKVCPDGTSAGRTGPSCEFAACPTANVILSSIGATLLIPEGYTSLPVDPKNLTLVASFVSTTTDPTMNSISIEKYSLPENGKSFQEVLLQKTTLATSGEKVKSMDAFKKVSIAGREYYTIGTERFEGVVASSYYLPREKEVLRFDVVEHDVQNWTDATLDIATLPAHKELLKMLKMLQLSK